MNTPAPTPSFENPSFEDLRSDPEYAALLDQGYVYYGNVTDVKLPPDLNETNNFASVNTFEDLKPYLKDFRDQTQMWPIIWAEAGFEVKLAKAYFYGNPRAEILPTHKAIFLKPSENANPDFLENFRARLKQI